MARTKTTVDPAPHGRDENGVPKAPYGYLTDGTPRKSNRGRRTGAAAPKPASTMGVKTSLKDAERKGMLLDLFDMVFVTPLAGLSQAPFVTRRLGRHADALAGDAFIAAQYAPGFIDGLVLLAKTKPATLAWMDKAEENAPYILMVQAGLQMVKAVGDNHVNPNPRVAEAGRNLAALRIAQMAEAVNAEAERIARDAAVAATPVTPAAAY